MPKSKFPAIVPMTNLDRAAVVREHLAQFSNDPESALRDFLANIGHYCDAEGISLSEHLALAESNYQDEIPKDAKSQRFSALDQMISK